MGVLDNCVALITGASRGFGRATAKAFIDEGAEVVLHYRESRAECEELSAYAQRRGQSARLVQADFGNPNSIRRFESWLGDECDTIDVLVNNAGVMQTGPFLDDDEASWQRQIDVNILGPLRITRAVAPIIARKQHGKIINIASQLALRAWDSGAVYAGTKGFILSWTKSLAMELGPLGIRVNAIGPGSIVTDMNRSVYPDAQSLEAKAAELPLRHMGAPEDVAACAVFLASDASDFVTGQMLGVNGGSQM